MENFTPIAASAGGALIGLSALILWVWLGRVAGVSGIFGGLLPAAERDPRWRLAFLAGIPAGAFMAALVADGAGLIHVTPGPSGGALPVIIAGLLVGLGTRIGGGCTSGHGICGLARGGNRSRVAVAVFFGVAILTVFIVRHVLP